MKFKDWVLKREISEQSGAMKLHRKYEDPEYQAREESKQGRYGAYPTYSLKRMKRKQKK